MSTKLAPPHGQTDPLTGYHNRTMALFDALQRLTWNMGDDEPQWEKLDNHIRAVHHARIALEERQFDLCLFDGIQPEGVETLSVWDLNGGWSLSWHAAMQLKMVKIICDYLAVWIGTDSDHEYMQYRQAHELDWTRPDLGLPESTHVCRNRAIVWQRVRDVYLFWAINRGCAALSTSTVTFEEVKARKDPPAWAGRLLGWVALTGLDATRQRTALQSEFAAARRLVNATTPSVGTEPQLGDASKSDDAGLPNGPFEPPNWIREQFRQQQYKLLNRLWGGKDVPATELTTLLGYTNATTALENLHRRITETNKGLTEKDRAIGEQWEIGQRTRNDVRFYFLRRVTN